MSKHKVARGAASLGALQLLNRLLDLLSVVVLARIIAPEDFGLVTLATSAMLIAQTVTDLPVIDALVQRSEIEDKDIDSAFTLNVLRGITVVLVMLIISYPMGVVYHDMRLVPIMALLSLVPLSKSLESPGLVLALRELNYSPLARSLFIGRVAGTLLSVLLAIWTQSFWSLVYGLVSTGLISTALTYRFCPYRPKFRYQGMRRLIDFAGWITLSKIIFSLNQQGDRFFIGYFIGKGPLGQYTLGSELASMATYSIAGPVMRPIFTGMSRIQNDQSRLQLAYLFSQQAITFLVLPFGFGLATIADTFVPLILGPGWEQAIVAVWWIAPIVSLQMLSVSVHSLAMARGATSMLALREGLALILRLPATLLGAWMFGLVGALVARCATGIIIILMNLYVARKIIDVKVSVQLLNGWRSLLSVSVMSIFTLGLNFYLPEYEYYAFQLIRALFIIFAGLILYFVLHFMIWRLVGKPQGAESYVLEILHAKKFGVR